MTADPEELEFSHKRSAAWRLSAGHAFSLAQRAIYTVFIGLPPSGEASSKQNCREIVGPSRGPHVEMAYAAELCRS